MDKSKITLEVFDKQSEALRSTKRILAYIGGIQCGKTTLGAMLMRRAMLKYRDPEDSFIIAAPDYKTMNQATLKKFKRFMAGWGVHAAGPAEFRMNGGGICYLRTSTNPESMEGITNCRFVWGDEAGRFSRYFMENLEGRAAFMQAPICYTSTPYSMNWLAELAKETIEGKRDDTHLIQLRSIDSPYFSKLEFERQKKLLDPKRFSMKYCGIFGQMEGLVYDNMKWCESRELPVGTKYYLGIDWGFSNDPFCITVRAVLPSGMQYRVSELYKNFYTPDKVLEAVKSRMRLYNAQIAICDPAEPAMIEFLNKNGCPAIKGKNDIIYGIGIHYSLIQRGLFEGFRDLNPFGVDEYSAYAWPEERELLPGETFTDKEKKPVDRDNHGCDADRYVSVYLEENNITVRPPKVPEDPVNRNRTEDDIVKLLKRGRIDLNRKD